MKKQIYLVIGIIICLGGLLLLSSRSASNATSGTTFEAAINRVETLEEHHVEADEAVRGVNNEENESDTPLTNAIFVDVQGEVVNPGIFQVEDDRRVGHLIELAGGLTLNANANGLNQAARVYDEMVIFIPHIDDIREQVVTDEMSDNGVMTAPDDTALIALSTATALELQMLPGIGPVLSAAIVEHREANGPFTTVDELIQVHGFGVRTLENMRHYVKP
ncbi:MAG: helix-hairpin-helix domain-containing protein [Defluviitaleaceae bacterium]|nr:helix-hairpin-helix domain-containing protein [Defluviitaleaceae bacterium]